jgi:hypothetical protein
MSGFRDFQCPISQDLENSDLSMAYLPCSFYRCDGCRTFRKIEWDPTVIDSSPPDYCCAAIHFCCTQIITATTTVLAINDKYTLIRCLLTEFANNDINSMSTKMESIKYHLIPYIFHIDSSKKMYDFLTVTTLLK